MQVKRRQRNTRNGAAGILCRTGRCSVYFIHLYDGLHEDEVIRLWKELYSTIVFITHNVEESIYFADWILVLTNKPAGVKKDIMLDLPRPGDITSDAFIKYRMQVEALIKWW